MKETPIIMSGNHPKLILDGIKTMTRRVIKPQPPPYCDSVEQLDTGTWNFYKASDPDFHAYLKRKKSYPYGQVGDRLWVREKFALSRNVMVGKGYDVHYWATANDFIKHHYRGNWKPSIHMPRWASRITLEITEVRVERLQEISWDDTHKEGILRFDREHPDPSNGGGMGYNRGAEGLPERYESITAFMDLWDSLNAKRGYSWEVNPWVWVISFKDGVANETTDNQ